VPEATCALAKAVECLHLDLSMKNRVGLIVLGLLCLGLAIAVVAIRNNAVEQKRNDTDSILGFSNKWVETSTKFEDQKQVNAEMEKDLEVRKQALIELTNNFTTVSSNYSETAASLAKTEASLKTSQEELTRRDAKIAELETQNQALDKQAIDLSASITNLTLQIADTEKKLTASEGDKAFLQKELQRMMAEKAELERQFNDLTVLRAQVSKLKQELNIARRLEWIRQGLFASSEEKGAQKLMQGMGASPSQVKATRPTYDLNVEVGADGSVKVIPPPGSRAEATNSAPAK
jgi:chromosome segregation ATPase